MVNLPDRFYFSEHSIDTNTLEITRNILDTKTGIMYTIGLHDDVDSLLKLVLKDSRDTTLKNLLE